MLCLLHSEDLLIHYQIHSYNCLLNSLYNLSKLSTIQLYKECSGASCNLPHGKTYYLLRPGPRIIYYPIFLLPHLFTNVLPPNDLFRTPTQANTNTPSTSLLYSTQLYSYSFMPTPFKDLLYSKFHPQ